MASTKYVVNATCPCETRFESESPLCLGLLKAPEGSTSRSNFAWNLGRRLGVKVKEIKVVEVVPGAKIDKTCRGHVDKGYPILSLKSGIKVMVLIKRLHRKTGDPNKDQNPDCGNTHSVIMVLTQRQERQRKKNRNPISNPYSRLIKLYRACVISYLIKSG